ncbi:MAG: ABC transporter permease [Acidilobaceae archaeon]|nr:ABC transporter permease [Acidilobaceae archaeon]MCX8165780.1 ABC transporter permease [Acidilobaceae archaeon]MDW7974205.1 ABC transporter permease [Sulfolobales archaeon]
MRPWVIAVLSYRDLERFWKYKWWLAALVTMNLADLFIFALIFRGIVKRELIPDYFLFLAPGIASIAAFAAAFTIGREVMMELRRGFHHYLLSLPISRLELVFGRIAAGMVRGIIYQTPFLLLLLVLLEPPSPHGLLAMTLATLMIVASMSCLSIAASTLVKSLELQATIRSLLYFLAFFLSNVFYPESVIRERFPEQLYVVIVNNPISLATSIYREVFIPEMVPPTDISANLAKLAIWTLFLFLLGSHLYVRNLER